MNESKPIFGALEAVFDAAYLLLAAAMGIYLLTGAGFPARRLAGAMALVLAAGDAFHLVPRIACTVTGRKKALQKALGLGKLVTSLTMTVFYLLFWQMGLLLFAPALSAGWTILVWLLALVRMALCLARQNRWLDPAPPLRWGIYRNIPFVLLGALVAALFGMHSPVIPSLRWIWLAIALSFAFYIPVVLGAHKYRMLGMLMLPKTLMYLWILWMCVSI